MPDASTDAAVAGFIADALSAGQDCRTKLGAVKAWSAAIGTAK